MTVEPLRAPFDAFRLSDVLNWHIGDVVRKLREERRWNQTKLAQVAKVNKATVVRIEEGGNSKRETLEAVARALGVSLGVLYSQVPGEETQRSTASAEIIPAHAVGSAGEPFRDQPKRSAGK